MSGLGGENEFAVDHRAYEMSCSNYHGVGTLDEGSMGETDACK